MTLSTSLNITFVEHFSVWISPKISFIIEDSKSVLSVTQEIVLLGVYNEEDRIRHQLVVGVANYP